MIILLLILTLFIGIILKLPFISTPLDRDYGLYGYHGLFWLRKKKMPYVDIQENHPPGRWLLYALLLKCFRLSRHLFRISNLIFLLFTQVAIFFIAKQFFGSTIGLVSSALFGVLSSLPVFFWVQSNDEIQQVLFTTLAILSIFLFPASNYPIYYLIGISAFMALFFKQSAYVNTFPIVGILLVLQKTPLINFGFVFFGILSCFFLTWLFFRINKISTHYYKFIFALNILAFKTHLDNILFFKKRVDPAKHQKSQTISNKQIITNTKSKGERIHTIIKDTFFKLKNKIIKHSLLIFNPWVRTLNKDLLLQVNLFIFFSLIGTLMVICNIYFYSTPLQNIQELDYYKIWLWLGTGIITVLLNQHLMLYHFIPLLPPLSVLAAIGMISSISWLNDKIGIWYNIPILFGVFSASIFLMKDTIKNWWALEKKGRGAIFTQGNDWILNSIGELIGKYLKKVTRPEDQIYVWGAEYEIYLWAEHPSPTNSLFCPRPELSFSIDPYGEERQILYQLIKNPPKYIIVYSYTEGFRRFELFLQHYYFLKSKVFGEIGIYRRISDPIPEKDITAANDTKNTSPYVTPHQHKPLVSIIILTFNALEYTKICVRSIQNHTSYPYEIIFVDNASTDGTVEYLQELVEKNPGYKLIRNPENKGFAAGNNQGAAAANGEYILLLNNDVIVSDDWLDSMVESLKKDNRIGMVGPITNYISGRQALKEIPYNNETGFYSFAKQIREYNRGKLTPRRRIAGFAILMKKNLYLEIGGLDETFGIGNFEDDDLCVRVQKKGYAIMVDEGTFIHHFGNQTFKANKIDLNQSLNERLKIFHKKWPDVDYEELLELKESLVDRNTSLINHGKQALDNGNSDEAIKDFSEVLLTNPIDTAALSGICFAYLMKGNTEYAMNNFTKMVEITPNIKQKPINKNICVELSNYAEELFQKGMYKESAYTYKMVVDMDPSVTESICTKLYSLAGKLTQMQKYEEAIFPYDIITSINPSSAKAFYHMGLTHTKMNLFDYAISNFKKVIELDSKDASAYNNLGVLYYKKNMHKDARSCFEKALTLDPNYEEAQQNLEKISGLENL